MLIGLSDEPPEILTRSPYKEGLLYFARNEPLEKARLKVFGGVKRCAATPVVVLVLLARERWMWRADRS